MKPTARAVALEALTGGGDAAELLDRELRKADLTPADRAFATELAYGTLKMQRSLAWSVSTCLNKPFVSLDARLRWILVLGAYQLLFLDRVPAHSAVDESVRLARAGGHAGIAGLANAVLRRLSRDRSRPPVPTPDNAAASLGLYASLPDWIAAHFVERFGFDDAMRAAAGVNGPPKRALRVDNVAVDAFIADLTARGVTTRFGTYGIPECLVIERQGDGAAVHEALASGAAVWQSEESQLAVHLLDPRPGEIVLDACCGRGVKTMMIARRLRGDGAVWSIDDDEKKLAALAKAAESASGEVVHVVRGDARGPYPAAIPEMVDAALVDAPCSSIGVIGRRPDARWRKHETDPARFASVQGAVLRAAAERVRPGGRLLYVTCSTHALEDEMVVDAFLKQQSQWSAAPLLLPATAGIRTIGNYALTIPGIDGADGFFYALLTRTSL